MTTDKNIAVGVFLAVIVMIFTTICISDFPSRTKYIVIDKSEIIEGVK